MCSHKYSQLRLGIQCCCRQCRHKAAWYVRVEDRNVLTLMLRKELVVFLLMWFWIQAKHIFFRNPQHKQNQSPAVTQTTSGVELHDYTLMITYQCPYITPFKKRWENIMNIPFALNCITICLPSLVVYFRMEMMSDFTITAICHMRTITSECKTYLCL